MLKLNSFPSLWLFFCCFVAFANCLTPIGHWRDLWPRSCLDLELAARWVWCMWAFQKVALRIQPRQWAGLRVRAVAPPSQQRPLVVGGLWRPEGKVNIRLPVCCDITWRQSAGGLTCSCFWGENKMQLSTATMNSAMARKSRSNESLWANVWNHKPELLWWPRPLGSGEKSMN